MKIDLSGCPSFDRCPQRAVGFEDLSLLQQACTSVHWNQRRKVQPGSSYWSHPTLTAGLVVKAGGGLRAACIAFGHDTVEEGGHEAWDLLQGRVARSVCEGIWALTPPAHEQHLPWMERKLLNIERLRACDDQDVVMVAAADKCATLKEMNWDMDFLGAHEVWHRMNGWEKPLVWYYEAMYEALHAHAPDGLMSIMKTELAGLRAREPRDHERMVGG